ncbi:MAG: HD domain-containing protein, partial [Planctomycetaceae bacterium]|nr:HD domain-containing protein [Planctomycetaceae bacterium]
MGLSMGLDERSIRELGIGCLLHDAGMLKMGRDLILSTEKFGPEEARQIVRHVEASSEMLENIRNIPHECRLVALQMHERADGLGYPNHISGEKMHPLSRIAAVADCYVAMISPRLYRPAHTPYRTIEFMLQETRKGRFDQASMRALLSVVSLFPIGSLVELSDGRIARVIRANRDDYVRPIVEILLTATSTTPVEIVDLKDSPETKIARVLE